MLFFSGRHFQLEGSFDGERAGSIAFGIDDAALEEGKLSERATEAMLFKPFLSSTVLLLQVVTLAFSWLVLMSQVFL